MSKRGVLDGETWWRCGVLCGWKCTKKLAYFYASFFVDFLIFLHARVLGGPLIKPEVGDLARAKNPEVRVERL
ncbi:hypothetical protein RBB78_04195 [Tunturiibacter empetritectus]|uniref:hypothetical protein n=1 Tax=Tunturiibacter empetritectus TaxID=3069691 RepID=UPI003D9ABD01